jgi:hypothetical protein
MLALWELCFAVTFENFLELGFGLLGFMLFWNVTVLFYQNILNYGLKPTAASKQESIDKAAQVKVPTIVRDRIIIAVLIFYFTVFFGRLLNRLVVR